MNSMPSPGCSGILLVGFCPTKRYSETQVGKASVMFGVNAPYKIKSANLAFVRVDKSLGLSSI